MGEIDTEGGIGKSDRQPSRPSPAKRKEKPYQQDQRADASPGAGMVSRQVVPQKRIANRRISHIHPPLHRYVDQQRKESEYSCRG